MDCVDDKFGVPERKGQTIRNRKTSRTRNGGELGIKQNYTTQAEFCRISEQKVEDAEDARESLPEFVSLRFLSL
jgi:hypothetical protein